MTRVEAFQAASKIVDDFAPRANSRGYADGTIRPAERVELVIRVAEWLLSDEATIAAAVDRVSAANPAALRALVDLFRTEPAK